MKQLPLAITCGDPAGIGPEIIKRWCDQHRDHNNEFCFIGPRSWLDTLNGEHMDAAVGPGDYQLKTGKPSEVGAAIAFEALIQAADGCSEGRFSGVVSGPINKYWMQKVGFGYPGQTEFFAKKWGGEPTMAFAGGRMKAVLATWHIPLAEVPQQLNEANLKRAVLRAYELCISMHISVPRIAVCGLNPHAGEQGALGREELEWINPLLLQLKNEFPGLNPEAQPADTLFFRHVQGDFDAVVALYHDQGLAPLKLIEFDQAVNITLGLPWVRTSPDHGTAFELAGTGKANYSSFNNAVEIAQQLVGTPVAVEVL